MDILYCLNRWVRKTAGSFPGNVPIPPSAALSIGAAAATGGLSALGQGLVRQASDPHPCVFAQTGVAAKPAAQPASPGAPGGSKPPAGKPDDVRQLLRNLFR